MPSVDPGEPGRSAQAEYERRRAQRGRRLARRWGRWAGVVDLVSGDPPSTDAWRRGADGERQAARLLQRALGDGAVLLHDRRVPGSAANIDLLVVAPSGVWVVDVKHWRGRVERRDLGGWRSTDARLFVGGRDRSSAVDKMGSQMIAVGLALGDPAVPVVPALCFVGADWGWRFQPFQVAGVWVCSPKRLARIILQPGPLDRAGVEQIASTLSQRLRPR